MVGHHQPSFLGRLQPFCAPRPACGRRDPHRVPGGGRLVTGRGARPRRPRTSRNATASRLSAWTAPATSRPPPMRSVGSSPWTSTRVVSPMSLAATGSSPRRRISYPACVRAVSTHRTRPRPGRCCPNASGSCRPPDFGPTSSTATATTERSRLHEFSAPWTSICPDARPSTCTPSPTPRSTAAHFGPSPRRRLPISPEDQWSRAVRARAGGAPWCQRSQVESSGVVPDCSCADEAG